MAWAVGWLVTATLVDHAFAFDISARPVVSSIAAITFVGALLTTRAGVRSVVVIMEAFGSGLVVEPYLANVVLGGSAVVFAGSASQKTEILPKLAGGELMLALAYAEPQARFDLHDLRTH